MSKYRNYKNEANEFHAYWNRSSRDILFDRVMADVTKFDVLSARDKIHVLSLVKRKIMESDGCD